MGKIIDISDDIISIGTENGGIREVRACDCRFEPQIGDEVKIFETETKTIVQKVEPETTEKTDENSASTAQNNISAPAGGINIVLTQEATAQNTTVTPEPVVYNAAGGVVVNKLVYCLLAFFLGWIGVHKFYAKRIGSGVIYLLFSWTFIPAFIAFIEMIIAICKPADANGMIII